MVRRIVVLSGGNRGLGAAIARKCLDAGDTVAAFSRSPSTFVDEEMERDPRADRFYWASVDGADDGQLRQFVDTVAERYGRIDVLVNNAGVGRFGLFSVARVQDIDDSLNVNLRSSLLLSRLCVPHMLVRQEGAIINVSSVNAVRGGSGVAVYSATKAALDGFTRALARELGPKQIRVNSVAPGYFQSEMASVLSESQLRKIVRSTPLGRLGTAQEMADTVVFLMSSGASFITGQTLVVDGGITC